MIFFGFHIVVFRSQAYHRLVCFELGRLELKITHVAHFPSVRMIMDSTLQLSTNIQTEQHINPLVTTCTFCTLERVTMELNVQKKAKNCSVHSSIRTLGEAFFFLAYSWSCMRPAAKKENKQSEHERVQFLGTTELDRGPYTRTTRQKQTLNTRGCLTRTPHGALKGTKARTHT